MAVNIEQHITIDRPIEDVWEYLMNNDEWRRPVVKHVRKLSEGPHGEGARYENTISMGRDMTIVNRITEFDPPRKMAWTQEDKTGPFYTVQGQYLLEPAGDGRTRFTLKTTSETVGVWGVIEPVMKFMFSRMVGPNLMKSLKTKVEQQPT